ncbi:MAG: diaminopimelate decarboxylase [Acidobacteriaceae bacterium]
MPSTRKRAMKTTPPAIEFNPRPFAYSSGKRAALLCGQVPLAQLAKNYGTPLYVYSADHLLYRAGLFAAAFADVPHTVCYSVKANSNLSILRLLHQQGAGFDIVSGGELERVLRVSKKAARSVVFSGVGKQAEEMDLALRSGILIFNVESEGELELLAQRASKLKLRASVALRVNPDVFAETHPYISTGLREHKFGIDIRQARSVYAKAAKMKWLDPAGVSVHIGSQIRSVEPFGAALERVATLVGELKSDGLDIRYVDAGGGLGIEYHVGKNFDAAGKVGAYAQVLKKALAGTGAHLLLEPGRFIIAQAGALVAKVLYVKKNGAKTFVVTDAGMNDLIRPALYQAHHEILPVKQTDAGTIAVDVVGPVCESGDFFARDRELAPLSAGDLIAVLDAGAYGMSQASNYNTRPRPAEVLVQGKSATLVRRRETVKDLLAAEIV